MLKEDLYALIRDHDSRNAGTVNASLNRDLANIPVDANLQDHAAAVRDAIDSFFAAAVNNSVITVGIYDAWDEYKELFNNALNSELSRAH